MREAYLGLAERFRLEVPDLELSVNQALYAWSASRSEEAYIRLFIDSTALNLHSFYSGLERLFEQVARHIDRSMPKSESWHYELLLQCLRMCQDDGQQ